MQRVCAYSFGRTSTAFDIPNECCLAVTHVPKSYWRILYNRHRDADVVKFDLIARTLFLHCLRRLLGMATKLERLLVHKADIPHRGMHLSARAKLESIEYSRRRLADEW